MHNTTQQKIMAAVIATPIAEVAMGVLHQGPIGAIAGIGIGCIAYFAADDIARMTGRDLPSLPSSTTEKASSIGYRLLNGKSVRTSPIQENAAEDQENIAPLQWNNTTENDILLPPCASSKKSLFSETLRSFTPSLDRIFLGRMEDGANIYCEADQLCHVALAGSTGGGKSSIMRMIISQLCKVGASVLLLNPHYTAYDLKENEDWTPFTPYLEYDPMECRKYETIEHYLKQVATVLIPKRREQYANSLPFGKPYFIVLDELPSIIDEVPDAAKYIGKILREGRKFGVFLIVSSQDFLVKTIDPNGEGGAVRKCYRTAFYVGGDSTTAKILLNMPTNKIPEAQLGKGTVMLRNVPAMKETQKVTVPYVDNQALYTLLGPSTYNPAQSINHESLDLVPPSQQQIIITEKTPIPATPSQPSNAMTLDKIIALMGKVDDETFSRLIAQLPDVKEDEQEEPQSQNPNEEKLTKLHRQVMEVYQPGLGYRSLGETIGTGKDKAGELVKDLRKWGYLAIETE